MPSVFEAILWIGLLALFGAPLLMGVMLSVAFVIGVLRPPAKTEFDELSKHSNRLLRQAKSKIPETLNRVFLDHAYETPRCEYCNFISYDMFVNKQKWLVPELWLVQVLANNSYCPDGILQKMLVDHEKVKLTPALIALIESHPNASGTTRQLATRLMH